MWPKENSNYEFLKWLHQKYKTFEGSNMDDHLHMVMKDVKYLVFNVLKRLEENLIDQLHMKHCFRENESGNEGGRFFTQDIVEEKEDCSKSEMAELKKILFMETRGSEYQRIAWNGEKIVHEMNIILMQGSVGKMQRYKEKFVQLKGNILRNFFMFLYQENNEMELKIKGSH